jgi:hypothetical protein
MHAAKSDAGTHLTRDPHKGAAPGRRWQDRAAAPQQPAHPLAVLQRSIGNQAVQRMLRRQSEAGAGAAAPASRALARDGAVGAAPPLHLQPKLVIGDSDDPLEREADRVAAQVLHAPGPALAASPAPVRISRVCAACEAKEGKRELRASPAAGPTPTSAAEAPPVVHAALRAPGQPLDAATRAFFEPRFGRDFGGVRIHADSIAAEAAGAVGARAFAVGRHIVMGPGAYAPSGEDGRRLLAHELTHTLQQDGAAPVLRRAPKGDYAAMTIKQLRKLVSKGDKEAVDALFRRYEAMSNGELARYTVSDKIAQSVYAKRVVVPEDAAGQGQFSKEGMWDALRKDIEADRARTGIPYRSRSAVAPDVETEGGTLGAARTDIPGLETREFVGGSVRAGGPGPNPQSNFPPATDAAKLPHTHGHAEQTIADELEAALEKIPRDQLKGRKVWMLIEREVCSTCAQGADVGETAAGVLKKLSLKYPEVTFEIKNLQSSRLIVLKGAENAPGAAAQAAPSGEQTTTVQVETKIEVVNSVRNADGTTVSEVEYTFGKTLDQVNGAAPPGVKAPSRILMRVTQNPDGAIASVESLSGEPQALAEALARKTLAGGAGGEATGLAEGASAAGAAAPRMALLFKGLKIGGAAAFAIITGYRLFTATPKERPRVLVGAAAGLAAGAGTTYLVCNALLDIETAGWGLLICGFVAGGVGGYAGESAATAVYDEATATDLDRAYHTLEGKPKNEIGIFNLLVNAMQSDGCVDADFVRGFMAIFPADASDSEAVLLAAQLANLQVSRIPPDPPGLPGRSFPPTSQVHPSTVCPGCHGRDMKDLVPPTMTPAQIAALKAVPTCATIRGQALNALRSAVRNLPPRVQANKPAPRAPDPASRSLPSNAHPTPPGVSFPSPMSTAFPSEQEQRGTKCPTCHDTPEDRQPWKNLGYGIGSGPGSQMTPADYERLRQWLGASSR